MYRSSDHTAFFRTLLVVKLVPVAPQATSTAVLMHQVNDELRSVGMKGFGQVRAFQTHMKRLREMFGGSLSAGSNPQAQAWSWEDRRCLRAAEDLYARVDFTTKW